MTNGISITLFPCQRQASESDFLNHTMHNPVDLSEVVKLFDFEKWMIAKYQKKLFY